MDMAYIMTGIILPSPDGQNVTSSFLSNHHGRRVGVAGCDIWHDGGVDDPQTVQTAHSQFRIRHRHRIALRSHLGRANGVKDCRPDIAGRTGQIIISFNIWEIS